MIFYSVKNNPVVVFKHLPSVDPCFVSVISRY
jgi:hypothetical protein